MKKIETAKLTSIEGGITCDALNDVVKYLLANNPAQYAFLQQQTASGIVYTCTNPEGTTAVYFR